ncbi:hypothetical protein SS50377_20670 [Spironucleus salmonicida]|uniref:Uncharacterized protein n=1 Tax=Spironucleus salmonicida TaxID=348837 RepID=V6M7R7_9EUKA|nr:hypothetical protein SS50377_28743 [Spironucleus salmonicida]KAH0577319.1 hypothetical protein SS50377_20670 [Spironucleus salmonicida]|eukprot:EST49519.1 Hypothetical protein SS50377_10122 [Spironucleus salmonicida]
MDYSQELQKLYPELEIQNGILYMTYLIKNGAQPPKRFIFDTSLLSSEKVVQMNLRAVVKTVELVLNQQLEQLNVKEPDFNKFSFAVLQTGSFLQTKDEQISAQISEKLNEVAKIEFAVQQKQVLKTVDQENLLHEEEKVETQKLVQKPSKDYNQWDKTDLISYITMLESTNLELSEQLKQKSQESENHQNKLNALLEVRRRENFVPDITKKGEGEKRKFLFWL